MMARLPSLAARSAGSSVLAILLAMTGLMSPGMAGPVDTKLDLSIQEKAPGDKVYFLVSLQSQADLSMVRGGDRHQAIYGALRQVAAASQGPILRLLQAEGIPHRAFFITNVISVTGSAGLAQELAARDDVAHVYLDATSKLQSPKVAPRTRATTWNLDLIGAPALWARGFRGEGVVIGGQDTGYDYLHPALLKHYRGYAPGGIYHNYNWHDAIHSGGGICGPDSPVPCDDYGHGTHTMGIMVGDDGAGSQIGVAPGARYIGCRNMDQGVGSVSTYTECFQWFLAPTDLSGNNPDPTKAPDIINNSWVCLSSEGCTTPDILKQVVENVRAAGILVVASAGNDGPACSTVTDPPAIYAAAFSVGATDATDLIADFSSRGPVVVDSSGRMKPDVSAPGVSITSSFPGGGYQSMSGTSMAGPHVAGLAALLASQNPFLKGKPDLLEQRIRETVRPLGASQSCGGLPSGSVPNNVYGFGRIQGADPLDSILAGLGGGQPSEPRLRLFTPDGSVLLLDILAYSVPSFGVHVTAMTVCPGASTAIVTGPGAGPPFGPHIRRFDGAGLPAASFYAYGTLRYGAEVAAGAVVASGCDAMLTGPGPGPPFGPHVRAFDQDGRPDAAVSFFAYKTLRYGVQVDTGEVDGDAYDEILTGAGAGPTFGPDVRGFDVDGKPARAIPSIQFAAFATTGYGVLVASGDLDGDSLCDIAATPGPGGANSARFRGFSIASGSIAAIPGYDVTPFATHYGGRPAAGDLLGSEADELLASPGPDPTAPAIVSSYGIPGGTITKVQPDLDAFPGKSYGVDPAAGFF